MIHMMITNNSNNKNNIKITKIVIKIMMITVTKMILIMFCFIREDMPQFHSRLMSTNSW